MPQNLLNFYSQNRLTFDLFFVLISIWSLIWKGLALWHASQNKEKKWFIAVLIINTAGILEIAYLFRFTKKRLDTKNLIEETKKAIKNPAGF